MRVMHSLAFKMVLVAAKGNHQCDQMRARKQTPRYLSCRECERERRKKGKTKVRGQQRRRTEGGRGRIEAEDGTTTKVGSSIFFLVLALTAKLGLGDSRL